VDGWDLVTLRIENPPSARGSEEIWNKYQ
jgi:hypothetical protein